MNPLGIEKKAGGGPKYVPDIGAPAVGLGHAALGDLGIFQFPRLRSTCEEIAPTKKTIP